MKKFYLFLIAVIAAAGVRAQVYNGNPFSFNRYITQDVKRDQQKVLERGIASYTEFANEYAKDGSLEKTYVYRKAEFNTLGYLVKEIYFSHKGKVRYTTSYEYNDRHQVTSRKLTKKGRTYTWHFEYHNDSLLSSVEYSNDKRRGAWSYRYFYNANNLLSEQRSYEKGELSGRIEFDYYPDFTKKEVRYYDDSLELEKTFRYDCGIGNSLLSEKQKDTLTKCSRTEELPDGTMRTIDETRNEKGQIVRTITTWNPNTGYSLTENFDAKNRLTYRYVRTKIGEHEHRVEWSLYKKGKKKPVAETVQIEKKDVFGFYCWDVLEEEKTTKSYYKNYTLLTTKN